ncbi:STAS domain-containing protein [Planctomycetota bacterium]
MSQLNESTIKTADSHVLVQLQCAKLDEEHTQDLQDKVTAATDQSPELSVIIDLSTVDFMPSLSIGALVAILQQTKKRNQRLMLTNLNDTVRQVLAMCRLDKLFEIYDTPETAIEKLQT